MAAKPSLKIASSIKYDVAISFLSSDAPTAEVLYAQLSQGLNVFFYPGNQEVLAGTNGLESMRAPFLEESRVVVVLYRDNWGQTEWTRVEETAITDRFLKDGWNFLFFLSLNDASTFPKWLPRTHVRYSYSNFGLDGAVGAIKARVLENGGSIVPATALSHAKLIQKEAERLNNKEKFFKSAEWIEENIKPAVAALLSKIAELSQEISSQTDIKIRAVADQGRCVLTNGRVSMNVGWAQQYINVIGCLHVGEYAGELIMPGENKWYIGGHPEEMRKTVFKPDLSMTGNVCWTDERKPSEHLSADNVADKVVRVFLDLVQHDMHGKIDHTPEWMKRLKNEQQQNWEDY